MDAVKAVVQKVVMNGKHGQFAVTTTETIEGSVTFSLDSGVWHEQSLPEEGNFVILSDLRMKRSGWRAMSARFLRPSDEQPANSNPERSISVAQLKTILRPLAKFKSRGKEEEGHLRMYCGFGSNEHGTVNHAEFVERELWPHIAEAKLPIKEEVIARELVEVAVPAYGKLSAEHMACFWQKAVLGSPIRYGSNLDNAAKYGVKRFYGPMLDLAATHRKTDVFSTTKYFDTHALRLGEVVRRFSHEDFLIYIDLAKKLLRKGIYDWSIEFNSDQWGHHLVPLVCAHGFRDTLEPLVNALIRLADIRGVHEAKYHYSYFKSTIDDLLPLLSGKGSSFGLTDNVNHYPLSPRVDFAQLVEQHLNPIIEYVRELHGQGAFGEYTVSSFFDCFSQYESAVCYKGIDHVMKIVRRKWTKKILDWCVRPEK